MTIEEFNRLIEKSNRGKSAASEHDLQVQCVNWFRYVYPKYACYLMAIPNGGWRNETVAKKLKAEGVVAGVPDLFLAVPKHQFHGLWIEMKNGKAGRVSPEQTKMISLLFEQGYDCRIVRSFEDFENIVTDYMS